MSWTGVQLANLPSEWPEVNLRIHAMDRWDHLLIISHKENTAIGIYVGCGYGNFCSNAIGLGSMHRLDRLNTLLVPLLTSSWIYFLYVEECLGQTTNERSCLSASAGTCWVSRTSLISNRKWRVLLQFGSRATKLIDNFPTPTLRKKKIINS